MDVMSLMVAVAVMPKHGEKLFSKKVKASVLSSIALTVSNQVRLH